MNNIDISNEEFQTVINEVIASGITLRQIADEFKVSMSTVTRWVEGTSSPHPVARVVIVGDIKKLQLTV